jgi:hypothetical protein
VMTSKLSRWGRSSSSARRGWYMWRASLRHDREFDICEWTVEMSLFAATETAELRWGNANWTGKSVPWLKGKEVIFIRDLIIVSVGSMRIVYVWTWLCKKLMRNTLLSMKILALLREKRSNWKFGRCT